VLRFTGDPWNRNWLIGAILTGIFLTMAVRWKNRAIGPALWMFPATVALSFLLYRFLPLDPGPILAWSALAIPLPVGIVWMLTTQYRERPEQERDRLVYLSDLLRSFHHNQAPRRSTDALLLTLNNLPPRIDSDWRQMALQDIRDYEGVVLPQLRLLEGLARGAGQPPVPRGAEVRNQQRQLTVIRRLVNDLRDDSEAPGKLRTKLAQVTGDMARGMKWIQEVRSRSDRDLGMNLIESLQLYVASRGRNYPLRLEHAGAPSMDVVVRFRKPDLDHVLDVLVENAATAMTQSSHREIRIRPSLGPGPVAHLRMSDTGPGIPPGLEDRLFDPGVTTSNVSGKGMGLHLARRLMERYGGRIRVDKDAAPGACFALEFEILDSAGVNP
jgi:signal transduction histidine kinase